MRYVDAFVLIVPRAKIGAYKKLAQEGGKLWMKYGALEYMETVGDDLHPDAGGMKIQTFPRLLKLKRNEVPVFSYIVYKSRAHRDSVNAKVMKDPSMQPDAMKHAEMPFDMAKMAYGGFKAIVDVSKKR